MISQYTLIHIEIVLNDHTFMPQYFFSGWDIKMSPEKICTPFISCIHPHLTFIWVIIKKWRNPERLNH